MIETEDEYVLTMLKHVDMTDVDEVAIAQYMSGNLADKDDRDQVGREKPIPCVTGCAGGIKCTADKKRIDIDTYCPAHLTMFYKELLAKRVGVSVDALKGAMYGEYWAVKDVTVRMRKQFKATNKRIQSEMEGADQDDDDQEEDVACAAVREGATFQLRLQRSASSSITTRWR